MLQSLLSLSDDDIGLVMDTVRNWCSERQFDVDSSEGHHAVSVAVDLVQTTTSRETFLQDLSERLDLR